MKLKTKVLGSVKKAHVMEMQLHQKCDTRTFQLEYESYSYEIDPTRRDLYSRQGNVLIIGANRKVVVLVDEEEEVA